MLYQILPNFIFLVCVLGILAMILRRLPEVSDADKDSKQKAPASNLLDKGLPTQAASKIKTWFKFWLGKIWNFMLEAKDLKPAASTGYQIRKLFGKKPVIMPTQPNPLPKAAEPQKPEPLIEPREKNEQYYLAVIKRDPKKLGNYDSLAKYYLSKDQTSDALDVYDYLTSHDPANADYQARLAYCHYQLKNLEKTVEHYKKSVALDSSQPNRYYNLGLVLEILGKHAEAADAISKAINLEPSNPKFYLSLSGVYIKLDSRAKALEALKKARQLDPLNQEVLKRIEKLHNFSRDI